MTNNGAAKPEHKHKPEDEQTIHDLQPWAEVEFREWLAARHSPEPEGAD